MSCIDDLDQRQPGAAITVVLPELGPAHWWEQPLHTQTALRLKAALLLRPGTVVTSVPYHLERESDTTQISLVGHETQTTTGCARWRGLGRMRT